jgi:hypothetical protein
LDEAFEGLLLGDGEAWRDDVAEIYVTSVRLLAWLKLHRQMKQHYATLVCDDAARAGQLNSVKYLLQSYPLEHFTPALPAVRSGNVELVRYLIDRGLALALGVPSSTSVSNAVQSGSVGMLQFLQSSVLGDWSQACLNRSLKSAGQYGHVDVVKWLRAQGAEWPNQLWIANPHKWFNVLLAAADAAVCYTEWL